MKEVRRLIYVPILHAQADAERTAGVVLKSRKAPVRETAGKDPSAVDAMWKGIAAKLGGLNLPWHQTRIYQDGTPVCGNEAALAARLAASGNPNFSFILELLEKGATLEGTEDMDLLIQEYDLLNEFLMSGAAADQQAAHAQYQKASRDLLAVRDQYIFNRITDTLREGETAVVFMGVMHRLDKLLEKDFLVSYVIYHLPFRSIGTIYNA